MTNEKRPRQRKGYRLAQPFDSTFKDWMRHEANQAIPYLIEGAVCEGTLDTEIIRLTMQGANRKLLKQAMDELTALHGDDEVTLAQQYAWMQILLARTETIDEA